MNPKQTYNQAWIKKNRTHKNYLSARSAARSFIRTKATKEDLAELQELLLEALKNFKETS